MNERRHFILVNDRVRNNAFAALREAPAGWGVTIAPPKRSLDQNAKLHAMLTDLAASPLTWAGKRRTVDEWKAIIISGHAVATNQGGEVIPGIEGEFVAIRESSAAMSVARAASLIDYLQAFGDTHGVVWTEASRAGLIGDAA